MLVDVCQCCCLLMFVCLPLSRHFPCKTWRIKNLNMMCWFPGHSDISQWRPGEVRRFIRCFARPRPPPIHVSLLLTRSFPVRKKCLFLCSSNVLPQMVSQGVWRKAVVFRRCSVLSRSCSCSVAPWGHCCLLASL